MGLVSYASMRDLGGKNAEQVGRIADYAREHGVDLRAIDLDVQSEASVTEAVGRIMAEHGRIAVLVQNAGHMVWGVYEAFTSAQLAAIYDINVLGAQRMCREVLPHMRGARQGLLVWISSTSVAGGVPPLLGPYFAAKAAMDALAVCYAKELAPLGIETSIVLPGAFTTGTNHFEHAGAPDDEACAKAYDAALPSGFSDSIEAALAKTVPDDADPLAIGRAVADIVKASPGQRPLRICIDPADDGAAFSFQVIDRVREQFLHRIGLANLLHPRLPAAADVSDRENG